MLIAAALLAKRAIERGIQTKPWVKTSFAPGSKVVVGYLQQLGLLTCLEQLGFYLVGYGCTTCIGNSGPLRSDIEAQIDQEQLMVSAVLSGNRNFEGRIHPLTKTNWLASPPLVVAYALMGTTLLDITEDPIGRAADGTLVYLADIWPSTDEIAPYMAQINKGMFIQEYATLFDGDAAWQDIAITAEPTFNWDDASSYIRKPAFFADSNTVAQQQDIQQAAILALLGDSVTTDHISPAGAIQPSSAAGAFLQELGVAVADFNSYGARRGNHQVMTRGTFANIRLRNEMVEQEGGFTRYQPTGESMYLYDCAMRYQQDGRAAVVIAGAEYGTGSSRDWAAKGTRLLGVRAVIAESFERIHRSNLIGMGVLPLQFLAGEDRFTWQLDGTEAIDIEGIDQLSEPGMTLRVVITRSDGSKVQQQALVRIDTMNELYYYQHNGILNYVLAKL